MQHCFVNFYYKLCAEFSLPKLLEEPHQPVLNFPKRSFGQKKPVHYQLQLPGQVVQQLSGVGFIVMKLKMQLFCVLLLWHTYVVMVSQLCIALAYILMSYYGNIASNIRRDLNHLTRSLSFIIVSVWLFGESKCSEIQSQKIQIFKFSWGQHEPQSPQFWHALLASVLRVLLEYAFVLKRHGPFNIDLILIVLIT